MMKTKELQKQIDELELKLDVLSGQIRYLLSGEKKKFKIDGHGLYKTRDGRKAFVSSQGMFNDKWYGAVDNWYQIVKWDEYGVCEDYIVNCDLVSKWEEE